MAAQPKFDYQGALNEGYSDAEILPFLAEKHPTFDLKGAQEEGYSPNEINQFLSEYKPERSAMETAGRVGAQLGIGAAEMAVLPYELGVALPLSSPSYFVNQRQETLGQDIEYLAEKNYGKSLDEWSEEDRNKYEFLRDRMLNPQKIAKDMENAPINIGVRNIAEKITGIDLHPEGVLEKAASWIGFIKKPTKLKELANVGLNPKKLAEAIGIGGTDILRGAAAGTALQMAEEDQYGPVGTMAAAVIADIGAHGPKAVLHAVKNPKKTAAEAVSLFGLGNKKSLIEQVISDANAAGIQLDAGTLTDSNLIRMMQARAAQSALSGKALENFQKQLSEQFVNQYKGIADKLGEMAYENNYQAAEAIKSFLKNEESTLFQQYGPGEQPPAPSLRGRISLEQEPAYQQEFLSRIAPEEARSTYQAGENLKTAAEDIKAPIKEDFERRWTDLNRNIEAIPAGPQAELANMLDVFVRENEGSLLLGESAAEARVLRAAEELRDSLMTREGAFIGVSLRDLMKTKRTLGDVANWEFGGSNFQSQFKGLVGELDRAIENTLQRVNPELRNAYEALNAEYSAYKDLFENKNVLPLFEPKNFDYNSIYNQFARNPDKLRSLEDIFHASPRGQQLINQVKRDYAQRVIEKPNLTARDLRDLEAVLGPESRPLIQEFVTAHTNALERPGPRAARGQPLGAEVPIAETRPGVRTPSGRVRGVKTEFAHERQKLFEYLAKKNPDQIMNMMSSVDGIRKLKRAMSLTPEGKELFEKLSRYKLSEMIDRQMMDKLGENIRLNKFSGLLESSKDQSIVKELIGQEAFKRLRLLQKNAAKVSESANRFYNASKSGSTIADVGAVSTMLTGIFTGNPFMFFGAAGTIGGINLSARLLSNAQFLKYLEEAVLTSKTKRFIEIMKLMKPHVQEAIVASMMEARESK